MNNIFGGVLRGKNSEGMVYFIHLDTMEKVLVIQASAQKIQLIQEQLTKRDLEYATELNKNGELSSFVIKELKRTFELQYDTAGIEPMDRHKRITKYMDKQRSYIELMFAIHTYYMPQVKEILYSFYNGDELERHVVKYGY